MVPVKSQGKLGNTHLKWVGSGMKLIIPRALGTQLEIGWNASCRTKTEFGQHNRVAVELSDHRMEILAACFEGRKRPFADLTVVIEDPAEAEYLLLLLRFGL